jgi:hypothetical protein
MLLLLLPVLLAGHLLPVLLLLAMMQLADLLLAMWL